MRVSADQQATTVPMVALDPKEGYLALHSPIRKHLPYSAANYTGLMSFYRIVAPG
jgi:hypothetical protein